MPIVFHDSNESALLPAAAAHSSQLITSPTPASPDTTPPQSVLVIIRSSFHPFFRSFLPPLPSPVHSSLFRVASVQSISLSIFSSFQHQRGKSWRTGRECPPPSFDWGTVNTASGFGGTVLGLAS